MGLHCERLKRGKKEAAALLRSHNQEEKAKEIFVNGIKDNRPEGNILVHPYSYLNIYTLQKHYSHLGNTLAVGPARKLVGCAQLWLTIVTSHPGFREDSMIR